MPRSCSRPPPATRQSRVRSRRSLPSTPRAVRPQSLPGPARLRLKGDFLVVILVLECARARLSTGARMRAPGRRQCVHDLLATELLDLLGVASPPPLVSEPPGLGHPLVPE